MSHTDRKVSDNSATGPSSDAAYIVSPKRHRGRSLSPVATSNARRKKKKATISSPSTSSEANLSGANSPFQENVTEASEVGVATSSGTSTPFGRHRKSTLSAQIPRNRRGLSSATRASGGRHRVSTPDAEAIDEASENIGVAQDATNTTMAALSKSVRTTDSPTPKATGPQSPAEVQDKYTIPDTASSFLKPGKVSKTDSGTASPGTSSPTPQASGSQSPAEPQDDKHMTPYTTSSLLSRPGSPALSARLSPQRKSRGASSVTFGDVQSLRGATPEASTSEILGHGTHQLRILACAQLSLGALAFHYESMRMLAPPSDHWCRQPPEFANQSAQAWKNASVPLGSDGRYSRCSVYRFPYARDATQSRNATESNVSTNLKKAS